jgi:PAS domain S-box-containing protein
MPSVVMRSFRQTEILIGLGLLLAVVIINASLAYRSTVELRETAKAVEHSDAIIDALDRLYSAVQAAETGQRGYLLTDESKYLDPYKEAEGVIDDRLARIDELTQDDSDQQADLLKLREAVKAKRDELAETIALRNKSFSDALQEVMTDKGRHAMQGIQKVVDKMQDRERARLAKAKEIDDDAFIAGVRSVVLAAVLGALAIGGFLWLLHRYLQSEAKASAEVNKQRELLLTTLASIGDGVIATDHGCRVSFLNSVAERLTGWSSIDSHGKHLNEVFRIINERTREPAENPCERVLREGIIVGLANHTVLIAKDGREVPIDDSAAPIKDERGGVFGVVLVFRDVTEARSAAEARERLAAIVESSTDAIVAEDPNGGIISWNDAAERLFGYTAEEAIGKSIQMIVPPERHEEFTKKIEAIRRGEKIEYNDTVRVRKDGRRIDVASHIVPIRNNEGEVIGAAKIAHDISEIKRTERVLRFLADSSTELASLVDYRSTMQRIARLAVPFFADWCIVDAVDAHGQIQRMAYAHANPDKEGLLRDHVESYPLDWNSSALSAQVLRSGQPQLVSDMTAGFVEQLAVDQRHRDVLGQLEPKSAVSVPIMIRSRAIGTLNFVASESGRRFTVADVELASELARRAAVAIENARLYQDLKETERQKDDFLAMLAHELRNPISAIQYANALAKITGPGDDHQSGEVIERQVQNLVHLIDDLLDVSRITRNKIELRREPIDGQVLLQRAAGTVEPLIKGRKHALIVEPPREPLPLFVDPTRVEQILVNLLTNAAKYTPEGGRITARAFTADGFAVFKIKDTGLGIPEPMLHRVFELFTQVNPSLDRSQGGLGIGLTVVRKLAELHGGSVSAASEGPGRGSEFTVRLPLSGTPLPSTEANSTAPHPIKPQKVLVVDDNVDTARSLALLLRGSGHAVEVAHDGYAALDAARAFQPDTIVLDLGLPGIDGYKVAEQLRSDSNFQQTRLIALSGYGQADDRRRSSQVGFDQHLVKPVDYRDLSAAITGNSQPA